MNSGQKRRSFLKKGLLGSMGLYGFSQFDANVPDAEQYPGFQAPPASGKSVIDLKVAPIKQVRVGLAPVGVAM
jgi:hypothetical protein